MESILQTCFKKCPLVFAFIRLKIKKDGTYISIHAWAIEVAEKKILSFGYGIILAFILKTWKALKNKIKIKTNKNQSINSAV